MDNKESKPKAKPAKPIEVAKSEGSQSQKHESGAGAGQLVNTSALMMHQLSNISKCVANQNSTLMDLPKALQAQTETFRQMTEMLKRMSTPEKNESPASGHVEHDQNPTVDLITAATNLVNDSASTITRPVDEAGDISEDVRSILAQTTPQTDFGENLQEVVANSFSKITNQLPSTLIEEMKLKFKVPGNCKQLGVAKVNPEIWAGLPQPVKNKDAKAQHLQQHLSRALIAQAKTAEQIMQVISKTKSADLQPILKSLMDSAMSVGQAMNEINISRKYNLKPSLLTEYSGLASSNLPVTEYLFGDNLESSLKLIKSTSKIVKSVAGSTVRYRPYPTPPYRQNSPNPGHLNFRRQSFRSPQQMIGTQRQWRPNQQFQGKFKKFQSQPRQ